MGANLDSPAETAETAETQGGGVSDNNVADVEDCAGLTISGFAVDSLSKAIAFEITWADGLFDYTVSRNIHLLMTTNILERSWIPLGQIFVPQDTNVFAFTVTTNDLYSTARTHFLDSFNRIGFYRIALDTDSDDDGLSDCAEVGRWEYGDGDSSPFF